MAFYTGTANDYLDLLSDIGTNLGLNGWVKERELTFTNEKEIIWTSGASPGPTIGIRTYRDVGSGRYNYALFGMTGFQDNDNPIEYQPGASGSFYPDTTRTGASHDYGSYVPLINTSFTYWMSVSTTHIVCVAKLGLSYASFYLGFLEVDDPTDYPYPLAVIGSTHNVNQLSTDTASQFRSIIDPYARASNDIYHEYGGHAVLAPSGMWRTLGNNTATATGTPAVSETMSGCGVYPLKNHGDTKDTLAASFQEKWFDVDFGWFEAAPQLETTARTERVMNIIDSGGNQWLLEPCIVVGGIDNLVSYGRMKGIYWVSAYGGLVNEDEVLANSINHLVFQNGAQTESDHFWAMAKV